MGRYRSAPLVTVMPASQIPPIDLSVDTPLDPAEAWALITDPARIAEWFTDAATLGPVGSPYRLDFGDGSIVGGPVLEVDPGRSFAYAWHWDGAPAEETTTVTWTVVAAAGGGSTIHLLHDGWDEAGLDRAARDDHEGYWTGYLDDLRALSSGA
jgi:uncharacterized protein YndB with AHSA1/START domain